ncbi:MAG: hypothetical protein Q7T11_08970 [Deltaproteobacteria bacterium]|nr:hypothetical protein [Deltaproteobacteria bacterium]
MWLTLFILTLILSLGFLFWLHRKDSRYLDKPVREALGPELKKEIEKEKAEFAEHQEKFGKALEKAKDKGVIKP